MFHLDIRLFWLQHRNEVTYMAKCRPPPSLPNFMCLAKVATKPKVFLKLKTHKSNYSLILKINSSSVMLRNRRKEIYS